MIYEPSLTAVLVFATFVAFTLGLSFWFAAKTKSASGYFAAGGQIHWFVNGVAFAGDYLSAASFLGICGMIAFYGYDGFLYSIGYLAGWVVALFVIAEPLKRLGKYTFADALDSQFNSRGIKLAAAVSTLAVSIFYLIPQMVGAGVLVQPLLGFPHWAGVLMVGAVVITIVTTAGMVSTTYVQFLKGALLVAFSTVLVGLVLQRGHRQADSGDAWEWVADGKDLYLKPQPVFTGRWDDLQVKYVAEQLPYDGDWNPTGRQRRYLRLKNPKDGTQVVFGSMTIEASATFSSGGLVRLPTMNVGSDGKAVLDVIPPNGFGEMVLSIGQKPEPAFYKAGEFIEVLGRSKVIQWRSEDLTDGKGEKTRVFYPVMRNGSDLLLPGGSPTFSALRKDSIPDKLNFLSLMLALFCGTASLPHILIRYYTVKDAASARKSTVVGIGTIGFFYILTLFMGLGAMTSGALDPTNSNMAAPLLARSFGEFLFACISAIAFTTVLGTVAGLIVAAAGAVAHDLLAGFLKIEMNDHAKVRAGKITSVIVGLIAVALGIIFQKMNVNFLVGWAFSVAASANLPALVMLLFWKRTTAKGITASILVGMVSSLAWILLSGDTYKDVYGLDPKNAVVPFSQPGIVTIPLAFVTLIVVSLMTQRRAEPAYPVSAR